MPNRIADIKERIRISHHKPSRLPEDKTGLKTSLMLNIEARFNKPIEDLLVDGTLMKVADRLQIDKVTVWKWQKRLGLRDNGNSN